MKKLLFLTLASLFLSLNVWAQSAVQQGNTLRDGFKEAEALAKYMEAYNADNSNYEAIYNISYMNSRIGWRTSNVDTKKGHYAKGLEFAKKALALKPNDDESNFVMSVAMGRQAEIAGSKERVAASRDIKKYVDLALKYNPKHAGAWHVLGKWNIRVANLSYAEAAAAKLLFGGIPDKASNDRAVECMKNAMSYGKETAMYHYDLALAYSKMGKNAEAKAECNKAKGVYNLNPDNAIVKKEVDKLLSGL